MPVYYEQYNFLKEQCALKKVQLVVVTKKQKIEDILKIYELGHRHFAENYVQELIQKKDALPKDIHWHFIGHLQTNKVKNILPFIHLVQSVDSINLLEEINKQSKKNGIKTQVLIQLKINNDETKTGLSIKELPQLLDTAKILDSIIIKGLMGIASLTENASQIKEEFQLLKNLYDTYKNSDFEILSMGMSGDYNLAIPSGSNLIRIGSLLFGERV